MKIGLIVLEIGRKVGGLETYEFNFIKALSKVDQENEYLILHTHKNAEEILSLNSKNFSFYKLSSNRVKAVAWDLSLLQLRLNLDLIHALFVPPLFVLTPLVFTFHGSEIFEKKEFYPWMLQKRIAFLYKIALKKAAAVITPSNYLKNYLIRKKYSNESNIYTIHLAAGEDFTPLNISKKDLSKNFGIGNDFILVVGRVEPRKNPINTLKAYSDFIFGLSNPPMLVFAGDLTWSKKEILEIIKEKDLESQVFFTGHLSPEELNQLYSDALFVLFASFWEGFGLPILEAYSCKVALITSNCTSMPEIAGEGALIVDPHSVKQITEAMIKLFKNVSLKKELIAKGAEIGRTFSWEKTAYKSLQVYESILLKR